MLGCANKKSEKDRGGWEALQSQFAKMQLTTVTPAWAFILTLPAALTPWFPGKLSLLLVSWITAPGLFAAMLFAAMFTFPADNVRDRFPTFTFCLKLPPASMLPGIMFEFPPMAPVKLVSTFLAMGAVPPMLVFMLALGAPMLLGLRFILPAGIFNPSIMPP